MAWEQMQKLDVGGMHRLMVEFPRQIKEAAALGQSIRLPLRGREFHQVLVAGLGGSAIGGDLIRAYLQPSLRIPFLVSRHYTLPAFVSSRSLVLASSYSGDTEETLSAFRQAVSSGARVVALTSGGKLEALAAAANCPVVKLPAGYPPRAALGFSALAVLWVLVSAGLAANPAADVEETVVLLEEMAERFRADRGRKENRAAQVARTLHGALPILYSSADLDAVGLRWKGQISENAKMLAYANVLPELNHNEIVGMENPVRVLKEIQLVILRDCEDHPQVQRRMAITGELLKPHVAGITEVWSEGRSRLARLFSLTYLGDFVSYYLALLNGVDPTPVRRIEALKKKLAE